jgi:hypothetical protein
MKKDELRALHLASAARAKRAFKNFTLSQRPVRQQQRAVRAAPKVDEAEEEIGKPAAAAGGAKLRAQPKIYIAQGANVADEQRASIGDQLNALRSAGPGMALMIAKDQVEEVIQANEIDLTDLIDQMEKAKTGTQFYSGNSTLKESIANQAQVDKFFSKYDLNKSGDKEDDDADE